MNNFKVLDIFCQVAKFPNFCWFLTPLTMSENICFIIISPEGCCFFINFANLFDKLYHTDFIFKFLWLPLRLNLFILISHFCFQYYELCALPRSFEVISIFNFQNYELFCFSICMNPFYSTCRNSLSGMLNANICLMCYFYFASHPLNVYSDRTTFLRVFKLKYIKMLMLIILE